MSDEEVQRLKAELKIQREATAIQLKYRKEDQERIEDLESIIKNKSGIMDAWQDKIDKLVQQNNELEKASIIHRDKITEYKAENKKLIDLMNRLITEPHELMDIKYMIKKALKEPKNA